MKAKKRVVTSPHPPRPRRTPTVRRVKSAIVPARPAPVRPAVATLAISAAAADLAALDSVDLSVDLGRGLVLDNPILVASGTFGYGVEYGEVVDVQRLGAICCKGTTLRPRIGNVTPRVTETPAGMLNSIGLQNPGVDAVVERYTPVWQGWHTPVIVNVAGESVADYVEVVRRLDGVPGVAGIELNISCPNVGKGGIQFAIDADAAGSVTAAVRRATDLPLLVKLSPNVADVRPIARAIAGAGADALTAVNTLSGIAVAPSRRKPLLGNVYGGLSGPAIKPVALRVVYEVAQVVDIPIVAIGGITELADVLDYLAVGAVAVQVGTAIFADPTLP
ncbi:MAG: dihydroorotate dehydrogenase, partial [Chloroflexota bacterium]|nr:dihydroorotate dehydrogenase [Chloroflexota bacterium]